MSTAPLPRDGVSTRLTLPLRPAQTPSPIQGSFADLGTPLHEVTFVVVDLETTGGSPHDCEITEIGAVKVRAGEVIGEFQTLVNPVGPIPPLITVLTGITSAMVATAPRIAAALPAFLEFAAGAVLIAHNARFDVGFLQEACRRSGTPWPTPTVVDTVHLARQVLARDEVRNHRLSSLAQYFRSTTTPNHRALADARATVDVFHALLARVGGLGVHTLEELVDYSRAVPERQRRKRHLADGLPDEPGVYIFTDGHGRALYVGRSVSIRARVRSYFTASEQRRRIREMVSIATGVTPIPCPTPIEAQVREVRLIAELSPPYNRRSRNPERAVWVRLTIEPFPRLSVVSSPSTGVDQALGPFRSRSAAAEAVAAVHEVIPLRQCTTRLSPRRPTTACMLADLGRCAAPCTGAQGVSEYAVLVDQVRAVISGRERTTYELLRGRCADLAGEERFESAAQVRDRMHALIGGAVRAQRLSALVGLEQLVAAQRSPLGGWEAICVRRGRLAGSCTTRRGEDPMPAIAALVATAEQVPDAVTALAAIPEESELVLQWLETPGVRVVEASGPWASPVASPAPLGCLS